MRFSKRARDRQEVGFWHRRLVCVRTAGTERTVRQRLGRRENRGAGGADLEQLQGSFLSAGSAWLTPRGRKYLGGKARSQRWVKSAENLTFAFLEASGPSLTLSAASVRLAAECFLFNIVARLPQQLQ